MATNSTNKIKGLWTFPNYLSSNPEGSLEIADNVIIDADDTLEPRRGQKIVAAIPDMAKQLLQYRSQILAHYANSMSFLDNNDPANITTFSTKINVEIVASNIVYKLDHNLSVNMPVSFTRLQDFSALPAETFFPLPSGLNDYDLFYVKTVIDKDNFTLSSIIGGPTLVVGTGVVTTIFDSIVTETEPGLRIKSLESNGNLYVTSNKGVKKISSLTQYGMTDAGGIQALNLEIDLNLTTGGFFGPIPSIDDVEVSYRMVWGTKDVNDNLIFGSPSQIATIANYTKRSGTVDITITVPRGITRDYFYQIYRTRVSAIGESGDEQRLVIEAPYDGYSATFTINDNTSDDIRDTGEALYTNETSGQGAFQLNTRPPVCKDLALYKNRAFYANTKTTNKLDLTFLGFDGIQPGLNVTAVTGTMFSATLTIGLGHSIAVNDYIALANTTSFAVDGQYQVTAITTTQITIAADSTQVGSDAVVYRSHVTFAKGTRIDRYFFVGRPETYTIVANAYAAVTSMEYFLLTSIDDKIKYYFWFKKNILDADPLISGKVGIMVDLLTGPVPSTAAEVAVRIQAALETVDDFSVEVDSISADTLYVRTSTSGKVTDPLSGSQSGTSLASITKTQDGFGEDATNQFIRLSTYISPAQAIEDTAKSLVRVVNQDVTNPVYAIYLSTASTLPGQINLEERTFSEEPFTVIASSMAVAALFNPDLSTNVFSTQTISPNSIYFSKTEQPEAVPIINRFQVGPKNKAILRILGLRDSLFILKEEGIYILTGESEQNFSVRLFDNSGTLVAPDSAVILNNQIYCITTQGMATLSENGGLQIISRNIENIFSGITSENFTNFYYNTFGVAYETDRAYLLYTVNTVTDTTATVAYRYNTFTQTFTRFLTPATCGIVQEGKNKLFLGSSDSPTIETERKKLTSRDYADREYTRQVSDVQFNKVYVDDAQIIEPGDVLSQKQYLKTTDYNRVIKQLKLDPNLNFSQSFALMNTSGTGDISNAMLNLASQLNIKDETLLTQNFNAMTNVNSGTNEITITGHSLIENDIVLISGSVLPSPLVTGYYTVTQPTTNTFKLRSNSPQIFSGTAAGRGDLSNVNISINFNMVREINYDTSYFLIPNTGLVEGDVLTFTTSATPPTGLVNGVSYEVVNVTTYGFQLRAVEIDLTAAIVSSSVTVKEVYYASGTGDNFIAQKEFNAIVEKLNNSDPTNAQILLNPNLQFVFFANYPLSIGFEEIDYIVNFSSPSQNYVMLENTSNMQIGSITHYKGIDSRAVWNYFTLGDPAMLKHIRSGSFMVKNNNLNVITVGYASDLSGNFENIPFKLDRSGIWGAPVFGNSTWGGDGVAYPLRTLIPKQKQRCRYIKPQVIHETAFRKFSVLGVSFDYEITSEKTSRK